MLTIDAQVHAYERNHPGRPWHAVLTGPPEVTGDQMVAAMDAVGVDGASAGGEGVGAAGLEIGRGVQARVAAREDARMSDERRDFAGMIHAHFEYRKLGACRTTGQR